jgi:hypothetical protein
MDQTLLERHRDPFCIVLTDLYFFVHFLPFIILRRQQFVDCLGLYYLLGLDYLAAILVVQSR